MALTGTQVARVAEAAGFSGDALVVAVAVAKAESGWRPDAIGDVSLQTAKWGPSVGLWQIRSLNDQEGTGAVRDASILTDPAANARSAYAISNGGRSWSPWTTYATGAYRQYLTDARQAVAALTNERDQAPDAHGGTIRTTTPETQPSSWIPGVPDPGDLIDKLPGVGGALDVLTAPARLATRILAFLANPDNWRRIGLAMVAVALAAVAVYLIADPTDEIRSLIETAAPAAVAAA